MKRFTMQRVDQHGTVLETHENVVGELIKAHPPFGVRIRRCDPRFAQLPFVQWVHKDGGDGTVWTVCDRTAFAATHRETFAPPVPIRSVPPLLSPPPQPLLDCVVYGEVEVLRRDNVSGRVEVSRVVRRAYVADGVLWIVGRNVRKHRHGDGFSHPDPSFEQISMFTSEKGCVVAYGLDYVSVQSRVRLYRSTEICDYCIGSALGSPLFRLSAQTYYGGFRRVEWDYRLEKHYRKASVRICEETGRQEKERLRMGSLHTLRIQTTPQTPAAVV